jgi:hypothetical protein
MHLEHQFLFNYLAGRGGLECSTSTSADSALPATVHNETVASCTECKFFVVAQPLWRFLFPL